MKNILLSAIALLLCYSSEAQIKIAAGAGLSINTTPSPSGLNGATGKGFTSELDISYTLSKLEVGIAVAPTVNTYNFSFTAPNYPNFTATSTIIPVFIFGNYTLIKGLYAGGKAGYFTTTNNKISGGNGWTYYNYDFNTKTDGLMYGAQVGYNYRLTKSIELNAEVGVNAIHQTWRKDYSVVYFPMVVGVKVKI